MSNKSEGNRKLVEDPPTPKPEKALSAKVIAAWVVLKHQDHIGLEKFVDEAVAQKLGLARSTLADAGAWVRYVLTSMGKFDPVSNGEG